MRAGLRTAAGNVLVPCLAALAVSLSTASPAAAANRDNRGTDFWLAFPLNFEGIPVLRLFITGDTATTGTVTITGGRPMPFEVTPGRITPIVIEGAAQLTRPDGTESDGIHVTAADDVVVYGLNFLETNSTDAYLALPTDMLGTEYMVLSYKNRVSTFLMGTEFAVVATEDGTVVTITPSVTTGSRLAGFPYEVRLTRGQAYQLMNPRAESDLSGTIIQANQKVAVFGAHRCAHVPSAESSGCNHLVEQLPPTNTWGRNFVTMPLDSRLRGDTFRIITATDRTTVRINDGPAILLNRGMVHEQLVDLPAHITSDEPILVAQYSNSRTYDSTASDPFMMLVPPTDQFLASYRVMSTALSSPPVSFDRNFINIVAPDAAIDAIELDGTALPGSAFEPIGRSGFSGLQQAVTPGHHRLSGPLAFGVSVYGFENLDGYGYPGGVSLDPAVRVGSVTLSPTTAVVDVETQHCVMATVLYEDNNPIEGVWVEFSATGPNGTEGRLLTDAGGQANFCYTGVRGGNDTIVASVQDVVSNTATVTWLDNRPPDVSNAAPTEACLTGTNHVFASIGVVGVTDPDNDPLTITITGITSDEATATVPGAGGEYHSPDAYGVGGSTATIRVERSGPGDGRVYRIWFDASDGQATASGSVAVGVMHDQNGGACAVDSGQNYDATVYN